MDVPPLWSPSEVAESLEVIPTEWGREEHGPRVLRSHEEQAGLPLSGCLPPQVTGVRCLQ